MPSNSINSAQIILYSVKAVHTTKASMQFVMTGSSLKNSSALVHEAKGILDAHTNVVNLLQSGTISFDSIDELQQELLAMIPSGSHVSYQNGFRNVVSALSIHAKSA